MLCAGHGLAQPAGAGTSLTLPLPAGKTTRAPRPARGWGAAKHRGPRSPVSVARSCRALGPGMGSGGGTADPRTRVNTPGTALYCQWNGWGLTP